MVESSRSNGPQMSLPNQSKGSENAGKPTYETYRELLEDSLQRITKAVNSKKQKDLIDLCTKATCKFSSSPLKSFKNAHLSVILRRNDRFREE